jgi:hypothetical protein
LFEKGGIMGKQFFSLLGFILFGFFSGPWVHAIEGTRDGGGGDPTEMRIDEIRRDILKWISAGGSSALVLPQELTHETYVSRMIERLVDHAVIVTSVTSSAEATTSNEELRVIVDGQPKTCRGFVSVQDGLQHILCNVERFAATSEADQYRLIHHEYAGLAGLERNIGASSDYSISNQITSYLQQSTVLRLAVLPQGRLCNVGSTYRTIQGFTLTCVDSGKFGIGWQTPQGDIWGEALCDKTYESLYQNIPRKIANGEITESDATQACEKQGGKLPTTAQYVELKRLFGDSRVGYETLSPRVYVDMVNAFPDFEGNFATGFWTSTLDSKNPDINDEGLRAYYFDAEGRNPGWLRNSNVAIPGCVRCILSGH